MNFFITTFSILALASVASTQLGDQQNIEEYKQCTCDHQYKGFHEWKEVTTQCFEQCRVQKTSELKTLVDTPVKLYTCIDQKINTIHSLFDCINLRLIPQNSCISDPTGQGQTHPYQDFRQVFIRNLDPLIDEIQNTLLGIDQKIMQRYSHIILDDCVRSCLRNKITQSQSFEKFNCVPKVNELIVKRNIQQCLRDIRYKETLYKICTCAVEVGANDLRLNQFCQKLRRTHFPRWVEQRISGFDKGLESYGNSMQGQRQGQRLLVKVEIQQQEAPIFRFDQDYLRGRGSDGFNDGGINLGTDEIGDNDNNGDTFESTGTDKPQENKSDLSGTGGFKKEAGAKG